MHTIELSYKFEKSNNDKLYEFLATDYNISSLATKINLLKNAKINMLSLKKISQAKA